MGGIRHSTKAGRPRKVKAQGNRNGRKLAIYGWCLTIWAAFGLVAAFFDGWVVVVAQLMVVGHLGVSSGLLERLSGRDRVGRGVRLLARFWIAPSALMVAVAAIGMADGFRGVLFGLVAIPFSLGTVWGLWTLPRASNPRVFRLLEMCTDEGEGMGRFRSVAAEGGCDV